MQLNPDRKEEKAKVIDDIKQSILNIMKRLDQTKSFDALISTLWYAYFPCNDRRNVTGMRDGDRAVLKYCEWKGIPISCSAIFSAHPTDQGMCCAFNMKAANEIYHSGPYSRIIIKLQDADAAASFANSTKPEWYLSASEPTSLAGHNKGLFLVLDAHSDQFKATTVSNDFNGLIALINPSGSFPNSYYERFIIQPGHLNSISISATRVDAADNMKDMDINDRQCLFSNENTDLKIHLEYSHTNCIFECSLLYAREKVLKKAFVIFVQKLKRKMLNR